MIDGFQRDIGRLLFSGEFFSIVAHSLYLPDDAKLRAVAEQYAADGYKKMAGYFIDGRLAGCAGVDLTDPETAVLHHLAVDPAFRHRGIGRKMIEQIMEQYSVKLLEAETDGDAVGFYRNCGFEIEDLGEKYPGVTRYLCIYKQ